jgi:hypothetical protein
VFEHRYFRTDLGILGFVVDKSGQKEVQNTSKKGSKRGVLGVLGGSWEVKKRCFLVLNISDWKEVTYEKHVLG